MKWSLGCSHTPSLGLPSGCPHLLGPCSLPLTLLPATLLKSLGYGTHLACLRVLVESKHVPSELLMLAKQDCLGLCSTFVIPGLQYVTCTGLLVMWRSASSNVQSSHVQQHNIDKHVLCLNSCFRLVADLHILIVVAVSVQRQGGMQEDF